MHARSLRKVLLIRSIDENDSAGEVLSLGERTEATRAAGADAGAIAPGLTGASLPADAERFVVRRAELLLAKLVARAPGVRHVLALAGGASGLEATLIVFAFLSGVALSALDGRQRIDILAFPLLGLIVWNAIVYVVALVAAARSDSASSPSPSVPSSSYARWIGSRIDALTRHSSYFNLPLAAALRRFADEWVSIARPLFWLRAQRLFHFGAAVLALGLVAGLYVRGLVLRYDAGWDSTFLGASAVRTLVRLVYGPASAASGIALPTLEGTQALRWSVTGGGAPAGPFIHLIALTAVFYIVIPRLVLVVVTSLALWRERRSLPLPAAFMPYARALLRESGRVSKSTASIVSYAYSMSPETRAGLQTLLEQALGGAVELDVRSSVAYGGEDAFAEQLRAQPLPAADCHVLLMNLAATPESENHGAMIDVLARELSRSPANFVLVIDESSYAARMRGNDALATRVAQRARTWREFAAARNQSACIVDLSRTRDKEASDAEALLRVREALQRTARA